MKRVYFILAVLAGLSVFVGAVSGCGDSSEIGGDKGGYDGGADGDGDADSDTDTDTDTDSDTDSDSDPEVEKEPDYRIPQGSGRYVFIPDKNNNAVVVIDSETLVIDIVDVGAKPTHLVPLSETNSAAVIAVDSDEVTIIRVDPEGSASTADIPVRPDTNALAVSNSGNIVIAFFDDLFSGESEPPGTDQEISVIETTAGNETVYNFTVGIHPQKIVFNEASENAFVITESGITALDLTDLDSIGIPPEVELFDSTLIDPSTVETVIDPLGTIAVARHDGSNTIMTATLDGSDDIRTYDLSGPPTDVDISSDGSFGLFVLRDLSQVAFFNLPLPSDPSEDPFTYVDLGSLVCGLATITPDGNTVVLHTTTGGTEYDQRIVTTLSRNGSNWIVDTALLQRAVESVAISPDSTTAIVMHKPISPTAEEYANAYTLTKLPSLQLKFQQIPVIPGQLLITPDGEFGYLLLRDDSKDVRKVDVLDFQTFIVDTIELGSPPAAAGYAAETDKVFVSQDHPAGRMTFIGVHDGIVKTVTGYSLNDEISQ